MSAVVGDDSIILTPMMRQYYDLKQQAGDAILLFRMGDFYEIFGSDALEIAPKLDLMLTSREKGKDQDKIPFCGVPHHSAKNYWLRILKLGYKVAIADQVEDPRVAKGIVKREIVRVLTTGCIDELEGLERDEPNYLMSIYQVPDENVWAVVVADVSTGELRCGNVPSLIEVVELVKKFRPSEVLVRRFLQPEIESALAAYRQNHSLSFATLSEGALRDVSLQKQTIVECIGGETLEEQPSGMVIGGVAVITSTIDYVRNLKMNSSQFLCVRPLYSKDVMGLDETAIRDLELFETVRRRTKEGSLFNEINRTQTPMGARFLRESIVFPLLEEKTILERQQAVTALLSMDSLALDEVRNILKGVYDLERISTRILSKRAQPNELLRIVDSLGRIFAIKEKILPFGVEGSPLFEDFLSSIEHCRSPFGLLDEALSGVGINLGETLDLFKAGYDEILDKKRLLAQKGQDEIDRYERELRQQTGISSLKIKEHKTFGLLIEVTKTNLSKVPDSFMRRQTMINCERFLTDELQDLSQTLISAHGEAVERELLLYGSLLDKVSAYFPNLKALAHGIAVFDFILGFATKARESSYVCPHFSHNGEIILKASRHPVVERYVGKNDFVANNLEIDPQRKNILITGPNMAGKSTIMRQMAVFAILHQIGSFVPADYAKIPLFDQVFTRVGAADDLAKGQSTFMVEMAEAANILRQATSRSLVILDEVGRGTSTSDGLAIASAIFEELVLNVGCYTLFATHYHELVPLAKKFNTVSLLQTQVIENKGKISFTHRIIEGASGHSFGIEVAKIAGIPARVVERSRAYLESGFCLARSDVSKRLTKESATKELLPLEVLGMTEVRGLSAAPIDKIFEKLQKVTIHRTTPLQALNILNDLKSLSEGKQESELFFES